MCGITGGWWAKPTDGLQTQVQRSLDKIAHRGPNDNGFDAITAEKATLVLGHTRLSIIDLSSAGHQPMHSNDGRHSLIFNGEIYNYIELREELKVAGIEFTSKSDTEVLLQAWRHWGSDCLRKLNGIFAFVVFDRQTQQLFCARDPFGVKPFFYRVEQEYFCFASELPALLAFDDIKPKPNLQRAYDYLVYGEYDSTDDTFVDGIKQLKPAQMLSMTVGDSQSLTLSTWWSAEDILPSKLSYNEAVAQVKSQFLKSVKLQLRSDVPLGVALSGGIDSSAVVCAMRTIAPEAKIHTFSYIAQDNHLSEESWVDRVNQYVGAESHKVVATAQDLALDLDEMIKTQGEPFGSTSIYAQYRVFQLAKSAGITVTLDGQGADELLAGYEGFPGQRLQSLVEKGRFVSAYQFAKNWSCWPNRSLKQGIGLMAQAMLPDSVYYYMRDKSGRGAKPAWLNINYLQGEGVVCTENRVRPPNGKAGARVQAYLQYSLSKRNLPALLRHADRNSMHFAIESRVPFLSLDLAELLLALPEKYLISNEGETKSIFRSAMRGIVPDDVLDRKDKVGFATPERDWLISMKDTVRQWLVDGMHIPLFNGDALLAEFDQIMAGKKQFSWQVWRWVNYCRWYQLFIKQEV